MDEIISRQQQEYQDDVAQIVLELISCWSHVSRYSQLL